MTNRTVTPLKWALLGTTMTAIGSAALADTATSGQQSDPTLMKVAAASESGEGGEKAHSAAGEGGESGEAGEAGEGGEAGEAGESGEGGEAGHSDSDADFLARIGYIRGHLMAGYALYKDGQADMAYTHMKHPGDEIYTDLLPELEERNVPGFAAQLTDLAEAVEHGADAATVNSAYAAVADALDAAVAGEDDEQAKLHAIVALTGTAAEEYAEGVVDGKLAELHEYQDAWGFVQIAHSYATGLATSQNAAVAKAAKASLEQIEGLSGSFKGLNPPVDIGTDPADLYVASARIAFAAAAAK